MGSRHNFIRQAQCNQQFGVGLRDADNPLRAGFKSLFHDFAVLIIGLHRDRIVVVCLYAVGFNRSLRSCRRSFFSYRLPAAGNQAEHHAQRQQQRCQSRFHVTTPFGHSEKSSG